MRRTSVAWEGRVKGEHTGGLSHRDIAAILGVSHAQVIILEKRALAKMAKIARRERMLCAEMFERRTAAGKTKP